MRPGDLYPFLRFALDELQNPATAFGLASRLLRGVTRLGDEEAMPVPPELLPMGARVVGQGYLNRVALPLLGEWLLPRWMREQSDPASPAFVPRSVTNLMVNQTARSWTALGLPGREHPVETLVDRWGLLTPVPGGPSLDWWPQVDGRDSGPVAPSTQHPVVQRLQGGLPVVVTAFEASGLRAQSEAWLLPLKGGDWAAMQVVLFNIADMPLSGTFRFALRPYNPEGISPVYNLEYDGRTLRADGRPGPFTWPRPDRYRLAGLADGDLYYNPKPATLMRRHLYDPRGLAHATLEFRFRIEPWEEAEFLAFMPVRPPDVRSAAKRPAGVSPRLFAFTYPHDGFPGVPSLPHPQAYSRAKAATTLAWRSLLDSGMRLELPDRELQESWEANRFHLLALHDGRRMTPGPDLYHSSWIRDSAVMLYALSQHGFTEAAAQALRGFLDAQRLDGSFVSQTGEWDSTGQVLWAAGRHLLMHPDPGLEEELRPSLLKGAEWLARTAGRQGGTMPPGLSSEHFGPPDRYFWDVIWSLAGLQEASRLLGFGWIGRGAEDLREALLAAWEREAGCDGPLPGAPGRRFDLSAVGNLAAWFPLGLFPPDNPHLSATLASLRTKLFYKDALFVNTGHSGWGTYLNMRVAGCLLLTDPHAGWRLLRWLMAHASPTHNWPEAVHPVTGGGSTGDGHHGWASAEWLLLVRSLLLREDGGSLLLTPALPDDWLSLPGALRVEGAPTRFGPVGFSLEWGAYGDEVRLLLNADWRTPPTRLVWALPGLEEVEADGAPLPPRMGGVVLPAGAKEVRARVGRRGHSV